MPTYRYECREHGPFDEHGSIHVDTSVATCPVCGARAGKVYVSPQVSPRLHPRQGGGAPPAGSRNAWEAGVVRDERGVPLYADTSKSSPIGVKDWAENRQKYESDLRHLNTHPDPIRS